MHHQSPRNSPFKEDTGIAGSILQLVRNGNECEYAIANSGYHIYTTTTTTHAHPHHYRFKSQQVSLPISNHKIQIQLYTNFPLHQISNTLVLVLSQKNIEIIFFLRLPTVNS